jgi:hypothetical protein
VNFTVDEQGVVIRTGVGSSFTAAVRNSVVAFQVDEFDSAARTGWSVTVTGHALAVTEPDEIARLHREGPTPWVPEQRSHFIRIVPELVSGRRMITRDELALSDNELRSVG